MSIYYLYCISYDENKDGKSVKFRLAVLKSAHKARYHLKYIDEFTNSALHLQAHLIQVIPKFYRGANINYAKDLTICSSQNHIAWGRVKQRKSMQMNSLHWVQKYHKSIFHVDHITKHRYSLYLHL